MIGGGILSPEAPSPGAGFKGSFFWVLGPQAEVGINALMMKDVRWEDGPYLGSVEGILTGGLSLLYPEGLTALPHAGIGLVF